MYHNDILHYGKIWKHASQLTGLPRFYHFSKCNVSYCVIVIIKKKSRNTVKFNVCCLRGIWFLQTKLLIPICISVMYFALSVLILNRDGQLSGFTYRIASNLPRHLFLSSNFSPWPLNETGDYTRPVFISWSSESQFFRRWILMETGNIHSCSRSSKYCAPWNG